MRIEVDKENLGTITYIKEIEYNGEVYYKLDDTISQIGDIALALRGNQWYKKGQYYRMVECCPPNGFKGIVADDGKPLGIHDDLGHFDFYRKNN